MFPGTSPFLLGYPVVGILIATLIGVNLHSSGFRKHLAVNSFLKNVHSEVTWLLSRSGELIGL